MRNAFKWLTSALFVAVVVQVGLAGYGIFNAIHKAKTAPLAQKALEDDLGAHSAFGYVVVLIMLLLLIVSATGKLGPNERRWSGGIFLLGVLQVILGVVSVSAPAIGFLHGINALAIYAAAALLAHRTWSAERAGATRRRRGPPGGSSGANRDRTGDLLLAKQALSQLSYGPFVVRV